MQHELKDNTEAYVRMTANWSGFNVLDDYIDSIKYDIQTFPGLLDQEVPNPQLVHNIVSKYISKLFINRDTCKVYLTLQLSHGDKLIFKKTVVSDWH